MASISSNAFWSGSRQYFSAIDLKGGEVVRLAEGDMNRATVYADDPAAQAMLFAEQGAQFLHVVDLDGAFAGQPENAEAVEGIIENFPGYIQLGGGIRNPQTVERWFDMGVARLVIGTAALKDPQFVKDMAREFVDGIVVAVDARDGFVATEGWAEKSDMPVIDLARRDGFAFDAYRVAATGPRKGGVIVIQEIFGLSDHIKEMAERFGAAGYEAIAPSMYDRAEPGFIVQPPDVAAGMARGVALAMGNGPDNAMNDVGGGVRPAVEVRQGLHHRLLLWRHDELACRRAASTGWRRRPVITAATSRRWLASSRNARRSAISARRTRIFRWSARSTRSKRRTRMSRSMSTTPAMASRASNSADYDAASDKLAFERTLDLFGQGG